MGVCSLKNNIKLKNICCCFVLTDGVVYIKFCCLFIHPFEFHCPLLKIFCFQFTECEFVLLGFLFYFPWHESRDFCIFLTNTIAAFNFNITAGFIWIKAGSSSLDVLELDIPSHNQTLIWIFKIYMKILNEIWDILFLFTMTINERNNFFSKI